MNVTRSLAPAHDTDRSWAGYRRWAWVGVLLIGGALFESIHRVVLITGNPRLLPAMVLFGALSLPVAFATFVWGRDLSHDLPASAMIAIGLVAGGLSIGLAGALEYAVLAHDGALPPVSVAVIEEGAKLVGPVLLLLFVLPRTAANGLLLGLCAGTGFAVLETLGYAFVAYTQPGGGLQALDADLLVRGILAPATHLAWTALNAAAVAVAVRRHRRPRAIVGLAATLLLTCTLHTLWDRDPATANYLLLSAISLTLLTATVIVVSPGSTTADHAPGVRQHPTER